MPDPKKRTRNFDDIDEFDAYEPPEDDEGNEEFIDSSSASD